MWVGQILKSIRVTEGDIMGLSDAFHRGAEKPKDVAVAAPTSGITQLGADSSIAEWLNHPLGGVIFRKMLQDVGQDEAVLRPVRRLTMKRLVAMSRGQFTEELMNDMIVKAHSGQMPEAAETLQTRNSPRGSSTGKSEGELVLERIIFMQLKNPSNL